MLITYSEYDTPTADDKMLDGSVIVNMLFPKHMHSYHTFSETESCTIVKSHTRILKGWQSFRHVDDKYKRVTPLLVTVLF